MQDRAAAAAEAAALPPLQDSGPVSPPMLPTPHAARQWVCRGVPYRRRVLTGGGLIAAAALFFFLALWQGATMLVSTLIGVVFIGGFVGYLWVVAPTPFTLTIDASGLARAERGRPPAVIPWPSGAKIKEQRFKNGKGVSLTRYKQVREPRTNRSFVVYQRVTG